MENTVKITSGVLRGRSILTPGGKTHPMGAREKLALFNMVASYLPEAKVMDAFAGSGALGIEAISRGAKEVIFIEKNSKAAGIIKKNLASLNVNGEVFIGDVANYENKTDFDLIIADPPYDEFKTEQIEHLTNYLKDGGILVLSHPGETPNLTGLCLEKTKQYAAAHLSVYVK